MRMKNEDDGDGIDYDDDDDDVEYVPSESGSESLTESSDQRLI